jgi:glyceraldehyde-3-phosphate dehydrogenase (NADP+)
MRFPSVSVVVALFLTTASHVQAETACVIDPAVTVPMVAPLMMKNGNVIEPSDQVEVSDVLGCCGTCPDSGIVKPQLIGQMAQMTEDQAMQVLQDAKEAWNGGTGVWPQMSLGARIAAIQQFMKELQSSRDAIIDVLMWEIGKNKPDATAEFDRTIQFINTMIAEISQDPEFNADWQTIGGTTAFVRRTAIGIIMCLGPYNYPLNETWALAFAALLAGNVLVLKIPTVGGLCHLLTSK